MPSYSAMLDLSRSVDEVFAFFTKTANLAQLAPPDFHLQLLEGPEILQLGTQLAWKGRRWGIAQKIIQEVIEFVPSQKFVEEQRQGPFACWMHTHSFESIPNGTRIRDEIQFEPPGGLLGRIISADFIRKDLEKLFAYRSRTLQEIFKS